LKPAVYVRQLSDARADFRSLRRFLQMVEAVGEVIKLLLVVRVVLECVLQEFCHLDSAF
jgi:hypothetical protein